MAIRHVTEEIADQSRVAFMCFREAYLGAKPCGKFCLETGRVGIHGPLRQRDGGLLAAAEQGKKRLGEANEIPMGDAGLVVVGVTSVPVDRAEHGRRMIDIHERAGAVVDGLAGDGGIVGVHHAMDESDELPARDQTRGTGDHGLEQSEIGAGRIRDIGV